MKTFIFGIVLGIAAAAGGFYALPLVDQHREISYIEVAPNGGNRESFHINIPVDRIMSGSSDEGTKLPAGIEWPEDEALSGVSAEMFKVRNERDVVIGVAARTVGLEEESQSIEWVVHLPARGSMFLSMGIDAADDGGRVGEVRAGTDEFRNLKGFVAERWVSDRSGEEGAPDGRIELLANYVARGELSE